MKPGPTPGKTPQAPAHDPHAMKKTPSLYWEDFALGTAREFGSHTVSAEQIVAFASEFDPQPFHLDEAAGKASLFGGLAASGWHTCALAMRMLCENHLLDSTSLGSPGLEHIKWLKPVLAGDTLRLRMEVMDARPMASRPNVGLVRFDWQVFNQRDQKVLTMQGWNMFTRRESAAAAAP